MTDRLRSLRDLRGEQCMNCSVPLEFHDQVIAKFVVLESGQQAIIARLDRQDAAFTSLMHQVADQAALVSAQHTRLEVMDRAGTHAAMSLVEPLRERMSKVEADLKAGDYPGSRDVMARLAEIEHREALTAGAKNVVRLLQPIIWFVIGAVLLLFAEHAEDLSKHFRFGI